MGKTILIPLQRGQLPGILQRGLLQIRKHPGPFLPTLFKILPFRPQAVQIRTMPNPGFMGRRHTVEGLLMAEIAKAVQPTTLLNLAPQRPGLPLNRKLDEQGTELQQGPAVHTDAVNAPTATDPSATTIQPTGHHQLRPPVLRRPKTPLRQ